MRLLLIAMLFFLNQGCYMIGLGHTPEPEYQVLDKEKSFEVRKYQELLIAETEVEEEDFRKAGKAGFPRLAGYIFGKNEEKKKIEMTAPVFMKKNPNKKWTMTFILPEEYRSQKTPTPLNRKISIKKLNQKAFAVIQFSGFFTINNFQKHTDKLKKWIKSKGYQVLSEPIFAGYDPPFTLFFLKRNEVLIEIDFNKS